MKIALIQLNANSDKNSNIVNACNMVEEACAKGAELIVLPEVFNYRGPLIREESFNKVAEDIPGESIDPLMHIAKENKVNIIAGSIYEKSKVINKMYNTSVVIDKNGVIINKYRKINLFKAMINGKEIDESIHFMPGENTTMCQLNSLSIGMSICYDLRFPELYRKYFFEGVDIIVVLSSFTSETGKLHWEVLLRARAIENYCYVLAPNQYGKDGSNVDTYGNTMIINPIGEVIDSLPNQKEGILISDLNLNSKSNSPQINI